MMTDFMSNGPNHNCRTSVILSEAKDRAYEDLNIKEEV